MSDDEGQGDQSPPRKKRARRYREVYTDGDDTDRERLRALAVEASKKRAAAAHNKAKRPTKVQYQKEIQAIRGNRVVRPKKFDETDARKAAYLQRLELFSGRTTDAIKDVGRRYDALVRWRQTDPAFRDLEQRVLAGCVEEIRDRDRRAVESLVAAQDKAIIAKAMDRLPEYAKESTIRHKHEGAVLHRHYELTQQETLELLEHAKAAIELTPVDDGTFE